MEMKLWMVIGDGDQCGDNLSILGDDISHRSHQVSHSNSCIFLICFFRANEIFLSNMLRLESDG